MLFALRGVASAGYVDVASGDYYGTSITNGCQVESLTVTANGCYQFIVAAAEFTAGNTHIPTTTPAGFTLLAQSVTSGAIASSSRTYVGVWWRSVGAGATGSSTITWGVPSAPVAHSIVIKPGA